eukprot:5283681-Ditylum_brightwellii.AAC.1
MQPSNDRYGCKLGCYRSGRLTFLLAWLCHQIAGLEKKGSIVNPHERSTVARHEVGHALVGQA